MSAKLGRACYQDRQNNYTTYRVVPVLYVDIHGYVPVSIYLIRVPAQERYVTVHMLFFFLFFFFVPQQAQRFYEMPSLQNSNLRANTPTTMRFLAPKAGQTNVLTKEPQTVAMVTQEQKNREKDGSSKRVFLRDDNEAWVPAVLVEKTKVEARCRLEESGDERTVKLKDYRGFELPRQNSEATTDLVDVEYLHEPGILYNLLQRNAEGKPYTRSGDLVVSVNPFQWSSSIYSESSQIYYAKQLVWTTSDTEPRQGLEPHIYEVSALSYAELAFLGKDQSILITGESGSGKTEAAKLLMQHIASIQRGPQSSNCLPTSFCGTVQRILEANPLLEAFGNAATSRNDNSSRFGKYTQLQFDKGDPALAAYNLRSKALCVLAGSQCEVYLLETSRVCMHAANERTYHIFYQLLAAQDAYKEKIWTGLVGRAAADFKYIGSTATVNIEGVSDADKFLEICAAFRRIGMQERTVTFLMQAVCIVMQLGNITFAVDPTSDDRAVVQSKKEFLSLSELMGISEDDLLRAFTERTMITRGETFKVPLSASSAKEACNAFAKEIYLKTFLWLVRTVNAKTSAEMNYKQDPTHGDFGVIGLLDIFGFESFETNGFGQLCINYANEKLQQKAINDIFRETKEEYDYEGIPLLMAEIDDNEQVLKVIEGRSGLIALLNEECYRPKGNDKAFVSKVLDNYKESRFVLTPKRGCNNQFGVAHYAGRVMYTAENFVESNQDTFPVDLKECAKKCSNFIVADHLNNDSSSSREDAKPIEGTVASASNLSFLNEEFGSGLMAVASDSPTEFQQTVVRGSRSLKRSVFEKAQDVVPGKTTSTLVRSQTHTMKDESPFSTATRLPLDSDGRIEPLGNKPNSSAEISNLKKYQSYTLAKKLSESMPPVHNSSVKRTLKRSSTSDLMAATVWTKYQEQLSSLMIELGGTHSRYVRCIKPNRLKKPKVMDRLSVTEQLRCAGIVATVKLARAIYPNTLPNKVLRCRYLSMWDQKKYPSTAKRVDKQEIKHKLECEAILSCALKELETETNGKLVLPYAVGKTRTYFRKGALEWLESKRVLVLDRIVTVIQRRARGMLARIDWARSRKGVSLIQTWYRSILQCRRLKLDRKATVIQKRARGVLARLYVPKHRRYLFKLRQVVPLIQRWYRRVSKHRKLTRTVLDKTARVVASASKPRNRQFDATAATIQKFVRGFLARHRKSKYRKSVLLIQRWYRKNAQQRKLNVQSKRQRYLDARNVFERTEKGSLIEKMRVETNRQGSAMARPQSRS